MSKLLGALDQGTTSTRFIVMHSHGGIVAQAQREHRQIYPRPGWVEHDAAEIWRNAQAVIAAALAEAKLSARDLSAVGVTNQRETTLLWDAATGAPLHHAIVWMDTRTQAAVDGIAAQGLGDLVRAKTGLPLATYFSALKLGWLLEEIPGARERAAQGAALFGTIDSWIIWNLTGGPRGGRHLIDATNASRTQLMNLETLQWDQELLRIFDVPAACLPKICSSSEVYGECVGALAGALVQWLRDNLGIIKESREIEALASSVPDNGDVYFVPAFSGLFAPRWRGDARGIIAGLTRFSNKGHIARAALEAAAFQTREVLAAMIADAGVEISALKVDGGMAGSDLLMQFQADLIEAPVIRPRQLELTAVGAAYAAGLAVGVYKSLDDIAAHTRESRRFTPNMTPQERARLIASWEKAVERSLGWAL